jgi:hypothetical protein
MTKLIDHGITNIELERAWGIDRATTLKIKEVIKDQGIKLDQFKSVQHLRKQCYNPPDRITEQMEVLNELIDGFGIESIRIEDYWHSNYWQDVIGVYVNLGDTYILTIIYNVIDNQFEFTSWGDFYESKEQEIRLDSKDY